MLTRDNVTAASRVMLPTYVLTFAALGANYVLTPAHTLTQSTALAFADGLMPLPVWGAVFLAASATMLTAIVVHRRLLFRFALRVCAMSMFIWAVVIGLASLGGEASPAAAVWPAFIAVACMASDRSLAIGER